LVLRKEYFLTDAFKQGFFEVQDANSQLPLSLMLNPECVL
jgi:16S rRNA C967 or C1407 C5-methylase (RsmB/RsmF family)